MCLRREDVRLFIESRCMCSSGTWASARAAAIAPFKVWFVIVIVFHNFAPVFGLVKFAAPPCS